LKHSKVIVFLIFNSFLVFGVCFVSDDDNNGKDDEVLKA
jgi:hypothetical protein